MSQKNFIIRPFHLFSSILTNPPKNLRRGKIPFRITFFVKNILTTMIWIISHTTHYLHITYHYFFYFIHFVIVSTYLLGDGYVVVRCLQFFVAVNLALSAILCTPAHSQLLDCLHFSFGCSVTSSSILSTQRSSCVLCSCTLYHYIKVSKSNTVPVF